MTKSKRFQYGMPNREQLIKELNKWESPTKLAEDLGASKVTVHQWMRKMGITKKIKYG